MELSIVISVLNIQVKEVADLQKVSQLSHRSKSYRSFPVSDNKEIQKLFLLKTNYMSSGFLYGIKSTTFQSKKCILHIISKETEFTGR